MAKMFSPVVLFVYNRRRHTEQTIRALSMNSEAKESDLIVYSDGFKDASSEKNVLDVRSYLKTISGFHSVNIVERKQNLGLAQSIISGVTEVVNRYDRVIILEDDLVTSPSFLRYMNDGLRMFENDDRVISIHGYSYPAKNLPETFFLKGADCWGWATWKSEWNLFEPDGRKLLAELEQKQLMGRFDFFGAYDYSGMLRDQIRGKNQSWAVRWYASALLHDKLTLYPGTTLVQHTGSDGSGTHCCDDGGLGLFDAPVGQRPLSLESLSVEEDTQALRAFSQFLKQTQLSLVRRLVRKVKNGLMREY